MDALPTRPPIPKPPPNNYVGLVGVLGFLLLFALLGIIFYIVERRKRRRFIEKAMVFHQISPEQADTLYSLQNDHKIAVTSELNTRRRTRSISKPRVKSIQSDDFYHLLRWIKRLKGAKNEEELKREVIDIVKEMEKRAHSYGLDVMEQKRLWDLAHLPEEVLRQYDEEFDAQ